MSPPASDLIDRGSLANIYFSPFDHQYGPSIALPNSAPSPLMQPVKFSTQVDMSNTDQASPTNPSEFRNYLQEFANLLRAPSDVSFAISNIGGLWWGTGLENYYTAFESIVERYERDQADMEFQMGRDTSPDSIEAAVCMGRTTDGDAQVVLSHTAQSPQAASRKRAELNDTDWQPNVFRDGEMSFMTDGYPLDPTRFIDMAQPLGVDLRTETMRDVAVKEIQIPSRRSDPLTVVERITGDSAAIHSDESFVEMVVVENPFFHQPDALSGYEIRDLKTQEVSTTIQGNEQTPWMGLLTGLRYLPLRLKEFEDRLEGGSIQLDRLKIYFKMDLGSVLDLMIDGQGRVVQTS